MNTDDSSVTEGPIGALMREVLGELQADPALVKADLSDVRNSVIQLREDAHRFEGSLLRMERMHAGTQLRLDRIETRLDINDI